MKEIKEIAKLASAIAVRRCALFVGSGFTVDGGGADWSTLVNELKSQFTYSSPLTDNFRIMGDLCIKYGRERIYEAVRSRLRDTKVTADLMPLMTLPWFTVFTTNYDLALENALKDEQPFNIKTVVTGQEFALTGILSEMLCVKLMGSLDIPYNHPGSMILDAGDFSLARENRSRIYDILANHAANLSFLFIGYSFKDEVFLEILDRLFKILGKTDNMYYAVFEKNPSSEKKYLFEQYGIETIVSDLKTFTEKITKEVALRNPMDFTHKGIQIKSDIVFLNTTKIGGFLSQFNPVLLEDLQLDVAPLAFLKGNTDSLKPFANGWNFHRQELDTLISILREDSGKKEVKVIKVGGNPGEGRTFLILNAIYDLIVRHGVIAIKIPNYSARPLPTPEELNDFLTELSEECKASRITPPSQVIFWMETMASDSMISQFVKLAINIIGYDLALIFEDLRSEAPKLNLFARCKFIPIDLNQELSSEEQEKLKEYIVKTVKAHKLPEIREDEVQKIILEEKSFLPIMYRTLDPARRSIDVIIEQEYAKVDDAIARLAIAICSLASFLGLDVPFVVLKKTLTSFATKNISYSEVDDIVTKKAPAFIRSYQDIRCNTFFTLNHQVIATKLINIIGIEQLDKILLRISESSNISAPMEADFINNLLIYQGVNRYKRASMPFSLEALEAALCSIRKYQPARPILHHLARLYSVKDIQDERIIPLLEEALTEESNSFAIKERKSHILTSLAKIKWDKNKEHFIKLPRNSPEINEIISLLRTARVEDAEAMHTYDIEARILRDLAKEADSLMDKSLLINEAVNVIKQGLSIIDIIDPASSDWLKRLLIEILAEFSPQAAEANAISLVNTQNNGVGFYILSTVEYYKNAENSTTIIDYLEKALACKFFPSEAIALKIEILLKNKNPDYGGALLALVNMLSTKADFYDTWESAYHKAIIYAINGDCQKANIQFRNAHRIAPRIIQRNIGFFWEEGGHRKKFCGKIKSPITEREGRIYSHNIPGWEREEIFFDPRRQTKRSSLAPGLFIDFELGFSTKGPIAFDVRPHLGK